MIKKRAIQSFKNNAGFTLIESVIGIGVLIIVLFGLFNLYLTYGSLYNFQNAQLNTLADGRAAMSELTLFTIQARRVVGNITFSTTTYYSGTSTLVLQLPAINSGGGIISNTWDYIIFYTNGANLYRKAQIDAASARISGTKLLTSNLQSIIFTYDNADFTQVQKVSIDLNIENQNVKHTATSHLTQQLILRNF